MDIVIHDLGDALGPAQILLVRQPHVGLEAIVVVDNVACGPAIGGIRMAPDVTLAEVARLARAMTFKNAAAESHGAVYHPHGLAVEALSAYKQPAASVQTFPDGQPLDGGHLVGVECEIWLPAARPDVLTAAKVGQMQAKLVLQGANIPATEAAKRWRHAHGILRSPDFIANAGGVICAAVEYHDGTQSQAFATIAEKIRTNTAEMLAHMQQQQVLPREAAVQMARRRVEEAMAYHRP